MDVALRIDTSTYHLLTVPSGCTLVTIISIRCWDPSAAVSACSVITVVRLPSVGTMQYRMSDDRSSRRRWWRFVTSPMAGLERQESECPQKMPRSAFAHTRHGVEMGRIGSPSR